VPAGKDFDPATYRGRVVGLNEKSVILKFEGNLQIKSTAHHLDGTTTETIYVQDNNQPPREFVFSPHFRPLPNGRVLVQRGHKVADLQLGDKIDIHTCQLGGVDFCTEIWITRRPGARVPPAVGDEQWSEMSKKLGENLDNRRWDVRMNTEQAAEEKGLAVFRKIGVRFLR
jgi:hypothetical protein